MAPLKFKDYKIIIYIKHNEGVSLEQLVAKFGATTSSRVSMLVNEKLINHTERIYGDYGFLLDMVGIGNDHFEITDNGLITLENKRDEIIQRGIFFTLGFICGILGSVITAWLI